MFGHVKHDQPHSGSTKHVETNIIENLNKLVLGIESLNANQLDKISNELKQYFIYSIN